MSRLPAYLLWTAAAGCMSLAACSREAPAPAPTAPALPAPTAPTPPPPPSPVAAAAPSVDQPIGDAAEAARRLETGRSLAIWAAEHADHADAGAAKALAARMIVAAGAAAAVHAPDGKLDASVLSEAAKLADGTTDPTARAAGDVALALLALSAGADDVVTDRAAAMAMARGTTEAGTILRAVWLEQLRRAIESLQAAPPELAASRLLSGVGRLLCPACADLDGVAVAEVGPKLLEPRNLGGVVCDAARKAPAEPRMPATQIAALSTCPELQLGDGAAEQVTLWSTNVPVVAALRLAHELASSPAGEGALAGPSATAGERVAALLARSTLLPLTWIATPMDADAAQAEGRAATPIASVDGLGVAGLSATVPALSFIIMGPAGVSHGTRAVVGRGEGGLVSLSAASGVDAGGRPAIDGAALAAATPVPDTGAIAELTAATSLNRQAATRLAAGLSLSDEATKVAVGTSLLIVDAAATAAATAKVLDALHAGGVAHIRVAKTATPNRILPLLTRQAPADVLASLAVGYERPVITVVSSTSVDVWAPSGRLAAAEGASTDPKPAEPSDPGPLPPHATPAYKGKNIVRLRVAVPAAGTDAASLDAVAAAIDWLRKAHGAGPVVDVIAGDGARAADVLRVARRFQEAPGTALEAPEAIWPGVSCGGPGYTSSDPEPTGCATGVAVAFSKRAAPRARGLTASPGKPGAKAPKPTPPPAPAAPTADFCDRRDLKMKRNRARGDFRFCYERQLQQNPSMGGGKINVVFTVGLDGRVGSASIASSTLGNKTVEACVLKSVKRIQFAKPDGGTCRVRWPIALRPPG